MASTIITIQGNKPLSLQTRRGKDALRRVVNRLQGVLSGSENDSQWQILNDETVLGTAGVASRAAAICRFATSSGSVGAVINGTSVTATWAGTDTASQALLVDAINANATVKPFVRATRYLATVTLGSVLAGSTIVINGLTYTATASTTGKLREFSISGTDAADAFALAQAINADPENNTRVSAVADNTNAVVYIGLIGDVAPRAGKETVTSSFATFTISDYAGRAESMVYSVVPCAIGNCCTFTATGTNVTVRSMASGKLGGGAGGLITSAITSTDR